EGTAVVLTLTLGLASWKAFATSRKALDSAGSPNTRKLIAPLSAAGWAAVGGAAVASAVACPDDGWDDVMGVGVGAALSHAASTSAKIATRQTARYDARRCS